MFGPTLGRVQRYAELLTGMGVKEGNLGPREVPRLWQRHLMNCGALAPAIEPAARVADVGSGAGLPGLVLALQRPDAHITLIEPTLRRVSFLSEAIAVLKLDNVVVRRARAEDLADEGRFDVVTARAVAPLSQLLRWAWPLVGQAGAMLAIKGATAPQEVDDAARVLTEWHATARVERYGVGLVEVPVTVVRVVGDAEGVASGSR